MFCLRKSDIDYDLEKKKKKRKKQSDFDDPDTVCRITKNIDVESSDRRLNIQQKENIGYGYCCSQYPD